MIRATDPGIRRGLAILLTSIALASCGGGGGGDDDNIDPANAEAVMSNLQLKVGGTTAGLLQGTPPTPSGDANAPKADAGTSSVTTTTTANSTASFPVSFQAAGAMTAIFAKVTGANHFFQADSPTGGKAMKVLPTSGNGNSFVITLQLLSDFQPGQFCLDVSGRDAAGHVSNVVTVCTHLVDSITQPAQDQPSSDVLLEDLAGTWISPCAAFQTNSATGSAKIGFFFDGTAYRQFVETWSTAGCPGAPDLSGTVLNGTLQVGSTVFLPQSGKWATAVDFVPDAAATQAGARTCFNVIRFEGGTPDRFFLGLPIGFTVNGQSDVPGSCVSAANRPAFLSDDIPFAPGSQLPVNTLPTADAGPNRTVVPGATVQLNGTASSDAEGPIASFSWSQVGTSTVTLTGANTATPSFTAPANPATLTFQLTVTDNSGATDTDNVVITVAANQAPTANAGADLARATGSTVQLNGSASSDPEGDPLTFAWTQLTGTTVSLTGANTATPSFTAPQSAGALTFQLMVTDSHNATDTDTVVVNVSADAAPTADAGPDQSVAKNSAVTLDGSGSSDSDGTIASFAWTQTGGPTVTLTGANTASPTFTAPNVSSGSAVLTFQLIVTDNLGVPSAADTVTVTVNAQQPPVADAGPDQTVDPGSTVQLDGTGSHDDDGSIVSFHWSQISGPGATLVGVNTATPTFTADTTTGAFYTFRLTVTDDQGLTSHDDVVITIGAAFSLTFSTTNFSVDSSSFTFSIHGAQPIGNWFTDQSSASPGPQGPVFNDTVATGAACVPSATTAGQIDCDSTFVRKYLGAAIDSCNVENTSTAKFSADTQTLTFSVDCQTGTALGSDPQIGIGLAANNATGPFQGHKARGSQTGGLDAVTNACNVNGCDQQ